MLRRIGRNFSAQLLALAVSFGDRFIAVGLLIRVWGAEGYGDWALLVSVAGLLQLAECGLNIHYGNVWQRADALGDEQLFARMLNVSLFVSALLAAALAILAVILALTIDFTGTLFLSSTSPAEASLIFALLALSVVAQLARGGISQIYRGKREFARGTLVSLAPTVGLIFGAILVVLIDGPPAMLAAIYLGCQLVLGWGVMLLDLKARYPELDFRMGLPTRPEIAEISRTVPWLAIQQGTPIAWLQVPVILLGIFSVTGMGLVAFVVLRTIVNFARQLSVMLSISAGVELASDIHGQDRDAAIERLSSFGVFLSAASAAFAAAIWIFGPGLVLVWTGEGGLFRADIIIWLIAGMLAAVPAVPLVHMLTFAGMPKPAGTANLVQLAAGLSGAALLTPIYGAPGTAAGLALGEAVGLGVVMPILASHSLGVSQAGYVWRCFLAMVLSMAWSLGIGLLIASLVGPLTAAGLVLELGLWSIAGLLPVLAAALPETGRRRGLARAASLLGRGP